MSTTPKTIQALQKHYLRILRAWPKDLLRSVTFHASIRRRLEYRFPNQASTSSSAPVAIKAAPSEPAPLVDEAYEKAQLNALYSLLENKYSRQYPVSEQLMHPASAPTYYTELAKEMETAPNRTWLQKKWLRLSKIVRFS